MSDSSPFPPPPENGSQGFGAQGSSSGQFSTPGLIKPRIRPVSTSGEGVPLGMSLTPPTPAPLPERGAGVFLFINLVAVIIAITFVVLLALKS